MAIKTKKYKHQVHGNVVRGIKITEKNLTEVVLWINRNGGAATGHNGDTRSNRPPRIRIKQLNFGENWGKRDWRVAKVGDTIIRVDHEKHTNEYGTWPASTDFYRVKAEHFDDIYEDVK